MRQLLCLKQEFIHNQRKINNGEDFPRHYLTDIFNRIRYCIMLCACSVWTVCLSFTQYREEEIIMPDEHVGDVKKNYQWKVCFFDVKTGNHTEPVC